MVGRCADMHVCGYAARRDTVIGACDFSDFRLLGILSWVVVLTFYEARHRIFLSWFC